VIDEFGYLPLDQTSANWIFHVVSRRYERGSIVLTSNRGFADWARSFSDQIVAGAIAETRCRTTPPCSTSATTATGPGTTSTPRRRKKVLLLQSADWVANFRDHNWRLFVITYNCLRPCHGWLILSKLRRDIPGAVTPASVCDGVKHRTSHRPLYRHPGTLAALWTLAG
jgi:IstB-like ATP binding protein